MDTALEALFKDMLNNGWFTKSDGDVESPFGYFGYVINTEAELWELFQAFEDTIECYGQPLSEDVIGSFIAYINSDGIITIERMANNLEAELWYHNTSRDYTKWGVTVNDPNVVPPF
jgi:hypothetical protein